MLVRKVLLLLLVSGSALAGPKIQHWQTSKGTPVYFVEAHELPMVDVQITFDGGSARDPQSAKGLASLTSSLLAEGAAGLDADQISFEFERLGANFGASAGYDSASLSLRSLSDKNKLNSALDTLRKVMSKPDFPEQAIERQRQRFLIGIQRKKQSPSALARDTFYAAVYGKHPYAFPQSGTEESIASIKRKDIVEFHNKYYVARNAVIAIVGDLSQKQAKKLAEKLGAALPKGKNAGKLMPVAELKEARVEAIDHPSTQTHILLGQPGLKRGDPDYFALYVGNHILGGSGLVSQLFKEIREKRALSYSAYSYFSPMREYGPFLAGLSTRADQAEEALQVLRENIESFIERGPSPEQLRAAKKNISGGFPLRIDSNSDILGYVAVIGFYNLPLDYLETFNSNVDAVSAEDVKEAFARRLNPERFVAVLVGPQPAAKQD
ncbi:MAG: insulinase family protein [Gammaproteobacteria bacterium]|nr:insulinase family protein [Gammaproteobacteria bacterium]